MKTLKENIQDLQKKPDLLNSLYKAGKISPRYNQHLGLVLQYFKDVINILESIFNEECVPLSEDEFKKINNRYIKPLLAIYSLLIDKIEKEMLEDDKALESIAMDFFRMSALPGIDTMVLIEKGGTKLKARVAPISINLKDSYSNHLRNAPIIVVNEKFAENIVNWILILHETSHLVSNFGDCLKTNNPKQKYECELFSDIYSTHISGYAYVNSLIQYAMSSSDNPYIITQKHPTMAFRVKVTLDHLKREFTTAIGGDIINKIELNWISWLETSGYRETMPIYDELRAEPNALKILDGITKDRDISKYEELLVRIKMIENNLHIKLTPIELLNYIYLSDDLGKKAIEKGEIKNLIIKWSKDRYGR